MPELINNLPIRIHPQLIGIEKNFARSDLTYIDDPFLKDHQVSLWIKRDDLLHPIISGNKWRKLKYNLDAGLSLGAHTFISMGGAYSNHLHALAYLGKVLDLKTIGYVRGKCPAILTPSLQDMQNWGMELRFISRSEYRHYRNYKNNLDFPHLKTDEFWIPEGGANVLALKGVAEVVNEIDISYDTLCIACGTGTTLAGLINSVSEEKTLMGFAAFKNANFLESDVQSVVTNHQNNWKIVHDYHFGGFAKINSKLNEFMAEFEHRNAVELEPVYTGKMLFGLYDLIGKGYFKPGQCIIALHTGGLQGNRGYT
jgi:1-aminocyclopropane-1-carboxylate deaminase